MAVFYNRLWSMLNKKGITKTEFRKLVDISTVTLAKLSKNEPVSLTILEKICQEFDCEIEDIVEIAKTNSNIEQWDHITTDKLYMVELYYLLDYRESFDRISFIYGYSIENTEVINAKNFLDFKPFIKEDDLEVWSISQTVTGGTLQNIIKYMEQGRTIGDFMNTSKLNLHHSLRGNKKEEMEGLFQTALLGSPNTNYRPSILLIPEIESCELSKDMQPFHAFGNEPLKSESLVMKGKRKLYYAPDGNLDISRMKIIKSFFQNKGFMINGIKDIQRLGDFELLSSLVDHATQNDIFEIESIVDETAEKGKIIRGFKITIFSKYISGKYTLQITIWNSGNPISDQSLDLVIENRNVVKKVLLPESCTTIELRLYDKNTDEKFQIIGYQKVSLMRDLQFLCNVNEKKVTLIDNFTKKNESNLRNEEKKKKFTLLEHYTSFEDSLINTGNDPWRNEFSQVYEDFNELYGIEDAESIFFEKGIDGNGCFREWLKKQINKKSISEVWLFDPFIDADSIPIIAKVLSDTHIKLNVITNVDQEKVETIRKVCTTLDSLLANRIKIVSFSHKKNILHDRILILCGQQYIPYVYNMSNSLDNIGMKSPSIISKLNRTTALEVSEYYLSLYKKEKLITIYQKETTPTRLRRKKLEPYDEDDKEKERILNVINDKLAIDGIELLSLQEDRIVLPIKDNKQSNALFLASILKLIPEDIELVFALLSYLDFHQRDMMKQYIYSHYDMSWKEKLISIVENEIEKQNQTVENLGLTVSCNNAFKQCLNTIKSMIDFPNQFRFDYHFNFYTNNALRLLIKCDFSGYCEIIKNVIKRIPKESPSTYGDVKAKYALLNFFICEIGIYSRNEEVEYAKKCLHSDISDLIAVGIAWLAKNKEVELASKLLKGTQWCHYFYQRLFLDLQIEDCTQKYRANNIQNQLPEQKELFEKKKQEFFCLLQTVKKQWCMEFTSNLSSDQLKEQFDELRTRSYQDVCDLVEQLYEMQKINQKEMTDYILYCLLDKIISQYNQGSGYLTNTDFENTDILFSVLCKYNCSDGISSLLAEIASYEKKLLKTLQDVFLISKNYGKWKCYIDLLIWCYYLRLLCEQNSDEYDQWVSDDRGLNIRNQEFLMLIKKHQRTLIKYSNAYSIFINKCNFSKP